jgi:hypothetical protein
MNIAQIEENVKALIAGLASGACTQEDFIYELLLAYGHRKQSVTRLRSGERNLASKGGELSHSEIIWKRHLYFKQLEGGELLAEIDQMRKEKLVATNKIRFVIVTDFEHLFAHDLKTNDRLDISLDELPNKFDFFLPWAGMEKAVYRGENPADVKAAEKMAKLFDLIKGDNFDESNKDDTEALHGLNVFLTRLLFCFFAEDTKIFADNQFSNAIQSHTKDDGSDLSDYLNRLFTVLNTSGSDRGELPDYLSDFPYVNGGLFDTDIPSPLFTAKSRRMLIECGSELDWSDINPDIFGSMIQAVVHPDQRGGMGMHYTSVTNIMKVIEPLFLNDLYEELEKIEEGSSKQKEVRFKNIQQRVGDIKIFDPACGSGNFLIIAYKEMRKLEMEVLKRLQELELEKTGQISQPFSVIKLSQFYGIELDDFAHEVAILSLWLAEHQMNVEFKTEFGETTPSLPLKKGGGIICGNATRIDWNDVCPSNGEVYLLGNPPYLGSKVQSKHHKDDMKYVFNGLKNFKDLDYISCWFYKASKYIRTNNQKSAFVTTNSICQGGQVAMLWPHIFDIGLEISFCHKSFKWSNSAKKNAGVICSIIGLSKPTGAPKNFYYENYTKKVENINSYLLPGKNVYVSRRSKPLSNLPKMDLGNMPIDGGNLILSTEEKDKLVRDFPQSSCLIKKLYGSKEFIRGQIRWCLWIEDKDLELANSIPPIAERINNVRKLRLDSVDAGTNKLAARPHQFREMKSARNSLLLISRVSSERRDYIPIGFLGAESVVADAQVIYDAELYIFGLLSSKLHTAWVKVVAGRLKTDFRYSSAICWNNFPVPDLSNKEKSTIAEAVTLVLMARESYPDKTIAALYDPEKMPDALKKAHAKLDECVESAYGCKPFKDDDSRTEFLFRQYSKLAGSQNA